MSQRHKIESKVVRQLQWWNRNVFDKQLKEKWDKLQYLESLDTLLEFAKDIYLLWKEINDLLDKENDTWWQKSRSPWMQQGNRNTKFFRDKGRTPFKASWRIKSVVEYWRGHWKDYPGILYIHLHIWQAHTIYCGGASPWTQSNRGNEHGPNQGVPTWWSLESPSTNASNEVSRTRRYAPCLLPKILNYCWAKYYWMCSKYLKLWKYACWY